MKTKNLYILAFVVIFLFSCSNENEITTQEKNIDLSLELVSKREPGQIPSDVNVFSKLLSVKDNEFQQIALLQEFKKEYGSTDFYNNLFELASFELFKNENFKNLGKDELKFLLDEMRSVESNMLNISNISVILIACKEAGVIDKKEFNAITDELISKNKNQIKITKWKNSDVHDEIQTKLNNESSKLYYPLYRY